MNEIKRKITGMVVWCKTMAMAALLLGKSDMRGGGEATVSYFDSARRTWTFDFTYNRSLLSFSQLYYNLFVNLAGQKQETRVRLRIDKESFFEIYEM